MPKRKRVKLDSSSESDDEATSGCEVSTENPHGGKSAAKHTAKGRACRNLAAISLKAGHTLAAKGLKTGIGKRTRKGSCTSAGQRKSMEGG